MGERTQTTVNSRPHCQKPSSCDAKGKGHCRRCHMAAAVKANWQDPEFRARNAAAVKANWQDPEFRAKQAAATKASKAGAKGVEIPKWVPVDLHDEFLEAAAWQGEEFAASHCRRLKHEASTHNQTYATETRRGGVSKSRALSRVHAHEGRA